MGVYDAAASMLEGSGSRMFATPGDLALALSPKTRQTPALRLVDEALVEAFNTPGSRLIITMPPQEGKSTRVGVYFPLWMMQRAPHIPIMMVSYADTLVKRNSRRARDHVRNDGHKLGLAIAKDSQNLDKWELEGPADSRGSLQAVSINGQVTGQSAEVMIIDDPHKDAKSADSKVISEQVWDWWSSVGNTRLIGRNVVVLILTRWRMDDLAGRLLAAPDGKRWKVLNIPAEADYDPEAGETDVLGRRPGQFMESATRSIDSWPDRKAATSPRDWQAMYQGDPRPRDGAMFPKAKWGWFERPMHEVLPDGTCLLPEAPSQTVIGSWDCTFKDTKASDFVVGQVWLVRGANMYLLDQVRGRMNFSETLRQAVALAVKWPQCGMWLVEDKANGSAVIETLQARIPGMVPETPTESKEARASAASVYQEAGNLHLPRFEAFSGTLVDEAGSFPYAAHDDQVDAMSQAVRRGLVARGHGVVWLEYLREQMGLKAAHPEEKAITGRVVEERELTQ